MDYLSMKRKELQALCKKHNIPANSANSVLADKLSQLLNEKEKPITRQPACLKSSVETTNEDEPAVSKREKKKVRFSPNNDVREYQRSGKKHVATPIVTKTRRKSVATKVDKLVVDNDSTNELIDDSVQIPDKRSSSRAQGRGALRDVVKETSVVKEPEGNLGKVTRSKANLLAKGYVVQPEESKQNKKPVQDVKKGGELVEETAVGRVRATSSKAVTDDSVGLDVNTQAKKKRGGQVAEDVQNAEPSDELMEIPARVTRSRQNPREDVNNLISNPKAEKKRTRREMKATDQSSNLSNLVSEDKQELPKRKSSRTLGVENMDEDQGDKEVVNVGRATRAKAQLVVKSGRDGKSRAEKEVVVPIEPEESIKKVGTKNVNLRKSVVPSKNSKVVIHPEEPVNRRTRNTRSSSVMSEAQEKVNEEPKVAGSPAVEKKQAKGKNVNKRKSVMPSKNSKVVIHPEEPVNRRTRNTRNTSVMPEAQEKVNEKPDVAGSPAVEKKQTKGKSVDVTKSEKVASELKTSVNATASPKSRKRKGTPVTEDQGIETNYGAVVDESARRATRSAGESEGSSAANKQAVSVKTPTSRIGKQSAAKGKLSEGSQIGMGRALRSGVATRGGNSNKRAKLTAPKQSDAEYSAVTSSKKGTPVSKLLNFEPGEKVVETELTPAILKTPSQTSIKKQPARDGQISTRKSSKFRLDPAVKTAPGRVTRSGIKDGGNASSYYAEKVEKKKPSRSAHQVQPLDDARISVPEVAEASPNPDADTLGVQSEVHEETMGLILGNTDDLSSPQMSLPTEVVEESMVSVSETAIVVESVDTVLGEKSSGGEPLLVPNLSETPLQPVSEVEVQTAVNSEKLDANEMDSAKTAFVSTGQQTEVMIEEQVVLVETTVVMEDNAGVSLGDAEIECDIGSHNIDSSAVPHDSFEQPDVISMKEVQKPVEPSNIENVSEQGAEDESASVPASLTTKLVSEDNNDTLDQASDEYKLQGLYSAEIDIKDGSLMEPNMLPAEENVTSDDVADVLVDVGNEPAKELESDVVQSPDVSVDAGNEPAKELESDIVQSPDVMSKKEMERSVETSNLEEDNNDTLGQATDDDKLLGLYSVENDIQDGMDAAHGSSTEPTVLPAEENLLSDDVADVSVDAGNEPAKELESDLVPSPDVTNTKEVERSVEPSNMNGSEQGAEDERASAPTPLTTKLVSEDNDDTLDQATDDDKLQGVYSAENDTKDGLDGSFLEPNVLPAEENITSEPALELESDVGQSTGTCVHQGPILGRSDNVNDSPRFGKPDHESHSPVLGTFDGEDGNVNTGKECETDEGLNSEHLLQDPMSSDGDGHGDNEGASTNIEHESNPKLNNSNNYVSDTSLGKNYDFNMNKQPEPTSEPSSSNDITETPYSTDNISVEDEKAHSKPYGNDVIVAPVIGEDDVLVDAGNEPTKELESDAVPSIDSDVPIMGTSGDENDSPMFGTSVSPKFDGEDVNVNEFETDEGVNSNKEHMLQETALSGDEEDDVNTNDERESDQTLVTGNDDDFSMTKQPESNSQPSSSDDIKETPFLHSDIPQEARDSYLKPLTGNDLIPIPVTHEDPVTDNTISVPKELETGLEPSHDYETLEGHVSGNVVDNEYVVDDQSHEQDGESERDKLASSDGPGTDAVDSEYAVDDQSDEQDGESDCNKLDSPGTDEQYVGGYDLEPENNENTPAATEFLISASHQESVPESNVARGKVTCYTAGVGDSVGPSDLPMSTETPSTPATSGDQVASVKFDVLEESLPNINKDVVANIFGDIYGLGSTEVTDVKNDDGNEQKTIGTSENIEGVSKESESVYPGMSDEQFTEEMNTTKDIDHASISDHCLDGGSNLSVDDFDTEPVEDVEAYEYPAREGSPSIMFTQEFSASPTSSKENERNEQGEHQEMDTCQGLEDYSFRMDEQKPISANESPKDNQVSDINTSARASFFKEGSSSSAAGLVDSVKNFDKASVHTTQADVMREDPNPNMNDEIFNWAGAGSSMKSLFRTPAAGRVQYVKDDQDDIVNFVDQDQYAKGGQDGPVDCSNLNHYSSQESLFTGSATTMNNYAKSGQDGPVDCSNLHNYSAQESLFTRSETTTNSYAKGGQDGPVDCSNLNNYSAMKSLFSTPATATTSHVKGAQEDQVEYSNEYHYSSMKSLFSTAQATATISHVKGAQEGHVKGAQEEQVEYSNEYHCEDSSNMLFEDEVDGSSDGLGKSHFEFRSHGFNYLAGAAGTGHNEASGLRESLIDSGSFEKETETQLKGPKTGDDNSF